MLFLYSNSCVRPIMECGIVTQRATSTNGSWKAARNKGRVAESMSTLIVLTNEENHNHNHSNCYSIAALIALHPIKWHSVRIFDTKLPLVEWFVACHRRSVVNTITNLLYFSALTSEKVRVLRLSQNRNRLFPAPGSSPKPGPSLIQISLL